jgi:hypothetical protein
MAINRRKKNQKGFMKPLLIQVDESPNEEVEVNIVTPRDCDGLKEKLAVALQETLVWKMRKNTEPDANPCPILLHLETYYKDQTIQQVLFGRVLPDPGQYPLGVRIFLFGLCAQLSGLKNGYILNKYEFVAKIWGGITEKVVEEICKAVFRDFSRSTESTTGGNIESAEALRSNRLETFMDAAALAMDWQPGGTLMHPLRVLFLTSFYTETKLQQDLFGETEIQKPKEWSTETKLFLFTMRSMLAGQTGCNIAKDVAEAFGGCTARTLSEKITSKIAIEGIISIVNQEVISLYQESPQMPNVPSKVTLIPQEDHGHPMETNESICCSLADCVPDFESLKEAVSSSSDEEVSPSNYYYKVRNEELTDMRDVLDSLHRPSDKGLTDDFAELHLSGMESEVRSVMEYWSYQTLHKKEKGNISSISVKGKNNEDMNLTYARLVKPKKGFADLKQDTKRKKATLAKQILEHLAGSKDQEENEKDEEHELLKEVVKMYDGYTLLKDQDFKYSIEEVAVLRHALKCSGMVIVKLDQFERTIKGNTRFPTQLKKKLAAQEKANTLDIHAEIVDLKMNGDKGAKPCLFWYVMNTLGMLERVAESVLVSGEFEDSMDFSSLVNKFVVVFGCDKDTEQTSMLMRTANRRNGNSKDNCLTLALYEEAAEVHRNLEKTILRKNGPVERLLQMMLDNRLFAFTFLVKDFEGNPVQSRCKALNLFRFDVDKLMPQLELNLQRRDDVEVSRALFECTELENEFASLNLDISRCDFRLELELIIDPDDPRVDSYHGFRLFEGNSRSHFYSGRFERALHVAFNQDLSCDLMQVVGFISCDKKNSWAVGGQSDSASAHANCIVCTQLHCAYISNPPDWMEVYDPNNEHFQKGSTSLRDAPLRDAPLREGNCSNRNLHKKWRQLTNNGNYRPTQKEDKEWKQQCFNVVNNPLLDIHPTKQTFGIMHGAHGNETHFKKHIIEALRRVDTMELPPEVDRTALWSEIVKVVERECAKYTTLSKEMQTELTANRRLRTDIARVNKVIGKETNELKKSRLIAKRDELVVRRKNHPLETGLAKHVKLQKGAQLLLTGIQSYYESQKPRGEAEYTFLKMIEITGSKFNAQHGGFEISHADGMNMLESWDTICKVVDNTYSTDSEGDRIKNPLVKIIMLDSKRIATPLYELNKLLKTQKKWSDQMIENDFKPLAAQVYSEWREQYPSQVPFPKLHDMVRHILDFVKETRMYGRLSEESFESNHQTIKREAKNVISMCDTRQRAEVLNRRLQAGIKQEEESIRRKLYKGLEGKKRGPYNTQKKNDSVSLRRLQEREHLDDLFYIDNDTAIKATWSDVYDMCVLGRAPKSWHRVFDGLTEAGDANKERARYTGHR